MLSLVKWSFLLLTLVFLHSSIHSCFFLYCKNSLCITEISYLTALYVRNINRVSGQKTQYLESQSQIIRLGHPTPIKEPIKELGGDKGQKARFNQCAYWRKECFQSADMSSMLGKNWEEAVSEELSSASEGAVRSITASARPVKVLLGRLCCLTGHQVLKCPRTASPSQITGLTQGLVSPVRLYCSQNTWLFKSLPGDFQMTLDIYKSVINGRQEDACFSDLYSEP